MQQVYNNLKFHNFSSMYLYILLLQQLQRRKTINKKIFFFPVKQKEGFKMKS